MGFWHIIDNIYLADKQGASSYSTLKNNNIKKIINLAGQAYDNLFENIEYLNVHIEDKKDQILPIDKTNIFLKSTTKNILIHCLGAFSRSPAIISAYLIKHYNYTIEQAIELLKSKRYQVSINEGFMDQLKKYYDHLILSKN